MSRALRPAAPADDLAAVAARGAEPAHGILTAELARFCQSGVSIVLGSRGIDGRPVAGRGLACIVAANGRIRIVLARAPNRSLLSALAHRGGIAATFTRPQTHRSIQLKSSDVDLAESAPDDRVRVEAQCGAFGDELVSIGYSETFAATYCAWRPDDLVAVEFFAEAAFVQTPGPGAGSPLL
jgi:hypothetical protein